MSSSRSSQHPVFEAGTRVASRSAEILSSGLQDSLDWLSGRMGVIADKATDRLVNQLDTILQTVADSILLGNRRGLYEWSRAGERGEKVGGAHMLAGLNACTAKLEVSFEQMWRDIANGIGKECCPGCRHLGKSVSQFGIPQMVEFRKAFYYEILFALLFVMVAVFGFMFAGLASAWHVLSPTFHDWVVPRLRGMGFLVFGILLGFGLHKGERALSRISARFDSLPMSTEHFTYNAFLVSIITMSFLSGNLATGVLSGLRLWFLDLGILLGLALLVFWLCRWSGPYPSWVRYLQWIRRGKADEIDGGVHRAFRREMDTVLHPLRGVSSVEFVEVDASDFDI